MADAIRDEDDQDLLTFLESGIRLREEISLIETTLSDPLATEHRDRLKSRLSTLREALRRNSKHEQSSPGEAGFLNYVPRQPPARQ